MRLKSGRGNKYYRGQCYEVGDDGHPLMFFVDYNCMRPIKIRDIRPIMVALMFPSLTDAIFLKGMFRSNLVDLLLAC